MFDDLFERLFKFKCVDEQTEAPVKEPIRKPSVPSPVRVPKKKPTSPIVPTPGIHPKPKAVNRDVELFKKVRERKYIV